MDDIGAEMGCGGSQGVVLGLEGGEGQLGAETLERGFEGSEGSHVQFIRDGLCGRLSLGLLGWDCPEVFLL